MTKRLLSGLLALVLLAAIASTPAGADDAICFTAVNDQLLPLSDETMPFWANNTFYVPGSAVNDNDLGIHYSRNQERSTIVLYKQRSAITFNYATGVVETNDAQNYTGSVIIRGDVVFLPLDILCRFFELEYSYTRIRYGYLLRIKSDTVVLSDATFIDAANSGLAQRYSQYERAHTSAPSGTSESSDDAQTPDDTQRTVYPVIEITEVSRAEQVLSYLSSGRATFLFTPASLIGADDLLRRLSAGGGAIALRIDAPADSQTALAEIDECNELIWRAASVKTRLVRLEGGGEDVIRAIADAGYCPIRYGLDFRSGSTSAAGITTRITRAADSGDGSCCVFLGTDETAIHSLSALLVNLRANNCTSARLNEVILTNR